MAVFAFSRRLLRSTFNNDFSHRREELVSDGQGGSTRTLIEVGTVRGRLRPYQPSELEVASRLAIDHTHTLYVEAPSDIRRGDAIVFRGQEFRVVGVDEPGYEQFYLAVRLKAEIS